VPVGYMKKGELAEGYVEVVDFPNKGRVRTEDGMVLVKGVLPGQKVRFAIKRKKSGQYEGRLLEVVEPSPLETASPACPHFGQCGGCVYQSLPYETQLELKQSQVKKLLDAVCQKDYEFEAIKPSPTCWNYRNKMEFSFGNSYKDGPLALGLHRKNSFYDIVTTEHCQIVHKDFCSVLSCTLELFQEAGISFYHKISHQGYLRHLLVRRAARTGELLIALVTAGAEQLDPKEENTKIQEKWLKELKERLLSLPLSGRIVGILQIENYREADVVQADATNVLYGKEYFTEELLGLQFQVSTFSFFQTNSLGAEVLYTKAREYVGETKDKVIFDLYSGTGTIAQVLAPVAKKVIGVEIVEEAVEAARENTARNGLTNVEFIAGDVLKKLDEIAEKPDLIVLDPPRDGVHPKALGKIIEYGVERIVYISCKPTSLARDLVMLQEGGYKVERVCCVDMFPWTGGIETVCLLSKLKTK
jgi:23S rRNA (uracil1939-C5)-methyltransferase